MTTSTPDNVNPRLGPNNGTRPEFPLSRAALFRTLGLAFLPVLIYIVVETIASHFFGEQAGIKAGLVVALAIGIGAVVVIWVRERRLDRFVLLDTALLVGLGGVSLALSDPIFFKLKPGLIEAILLVMIGLTAFTPNTLLIKMSGRYLKGITFDDEQIRQLRRSMRIMFWLLAAHIILIFYSAVAMDQKAWAFISGPLFYIVMLAMPVVQFIRIKLFRRPEVGFQVDLFDDQGRKIATKPLARYRPSPKSTYIVVGLIIQKDKDAFFLDRRVVQEDSGQREVYTLPVMQILPAGNDQETFITQASTEKFGEPLGPLEAIGVVMVRGKVKLERLDLYGVQTTGRLHRAKESGVIESRFVKIKELTRLLEQHRLDYYTTLAFRSLLNPDRTVARARRS